ncbi:MAG: hypothetical protein ACK4UJ_02315 [Leptonema sp. (in: bacteria)]
MIVTSSRNKILLLKIALILSFSCIGSQKYTGMFGWRTTVQKDWNLIEEMILQPEEYYYGRENLYFGENETIRWIYKFDQKLYFKPKFIVVLYSEINSPQPVEIDLRVVTPEFQEGYYFLRQSYPPLGIGKYILKIAKEEEQIPFDSVEFFVLEQKEIEQISGPILF